MKEKPVIRYCFGFFVYVTLLMSAIGVNGEPQYPLNRPHKWTQDMQSLVRVPPFQFLQPQQPFVASSSPNFHSLVDRLIGQQMPGFLGPQRLPQELAGLPQFPFGIPMKSPTGAGRPFVIPLKGPTGVGSPFGTPNYPGVPLNPVYIILGPFFLPGRPQGPMGQTPTVEQVDMETEHQIMSQNEQEKEMENTDSESLFEEQIDTRIASTDQCTHFSDGGSCYPLSECKKRNGYPTGYCRDVSRFCCIFRGSCGDVIQEQSAHFRNPDWPLTKTLSTGDCGLTIKKIHSDICYIRVFVNDLKLPANIGFCDDLSLDVEVAGKSYEKLCGPLDDSSYDVDVAKVSSIVLKIRSKVRTTLKWHLYITQIPCSQDQMTPWPQAGQGSKPFEPEPSKPKPTKVIGQEQPQPARPTSPKSCGVSFKQKRTEANIFKSQISIQTEEEDGECPECRLVSQSFPNPLLQSLEWAVPTVHESDLYKHAGTLLPVGGRVTYGQQTQFHEFPWAVAMYNNGRFHCGGSLIDNIHVLTAAHCVIKYKRRPSRLRVNLGDWNINSNSDGKAVIGNIRKIVTHPGYSTATLKYDAAVLTLTEPVKFTDTLLPVCLPESHERNLDGKLITVAGWGRDEENRLQSVLMKHSANVLSNKVCNQRWREKGAPTGIIADTMLCMDPQDGDSCKGDSGGPAILESPKGSGKFKQVGIVSFGSATCTDKRLPGVYTNVAFIVDWIRSQTA